jgi:AP-3 complex subunit mu
VCAVDPLYAFAFLHTFVDILAEYFGDVSAPKLRDNFDIVYQVRTRSFCSLPPTLTLVPTQLLEETLDAIGHPLTTAPNALRDIVLPPTLLSKVLAAAGASALAPTAAPSPFASAIPWRRANVRHAQNELYLDVAEELRAVVPRGGGAPLRARVRGRLDALARLSGTPDVSLSLLGAQALTDPAFHACVRLPRWARDRSLSFVPPDGRFVLAEYTYAPPGGAPVAVPLALKPVVHLHDTGGTIELALTSRAGGRALTAVSVELFLGQNASGANCSTSGVPDAGWAFDPARRMLRWDVPSLVNSTATLKGSFTSTYIDSCFGWLTR